MDESYIKEILDSMPGGLTRDQFRKRTQPDVNAGYLAEVDEAERRYFKRKRR